MGTSPTGLKARAAKPATTITSRRTRQPESPWASAPDREQQREAKRNAVLSTAAQMFNERGFHATSLDDIAASLHVSKPTLYYYVKNKDEILLECVKKGLHLTLDGIEASRQAGGNAVDQLRACMQVYADIVTQPFGMCLIRIGDEEVPEPSRTELRRMKAAIDAAFRRLVTQGVQEGSVRACDPKMTAFVIAGALSWIGRWYQPGGEYSAAQVAEQCIGTLMHGVLGQGGVPQATAAPVRKARSTGLSPKTTDAPPTRPRHTSTASTRSRKK